MLGINRIYNEDCLEDMKKIDDGSVDMILCDLPYGTTACKWDTMIPFDKLWEQYKRIIKPNGAIVLTAVQPFTSALIMSNPKMFKYCWYWKKNRPTGFTNAKLHPLKCIEDICVFSNGKTANGSNNNMVYYPQGVKQCDKITWSPAKPKNENSYWRPSMTKEYSQKQTGYPWNLLEFNKDETKLHPTQKPVALFEYLIKTYTSEGDLVLDNCIGSGTTAVAAINTNRNFIGFELDRGYFDIANERINAIPMSTVTTNVLSTEVQP